MKLVTLFFILTFCVASAQVQKGLPDATAQLYTAFHDIDIDTLSQMLCTKEKDAAASALDKFFLDEECKFRFVFTNAKYNYSPVKKIDGMSYCTISFRNVVRLTYFKPIDVHAKQKELKEKYKATEITYQKDRNAFLIIYNAKLLAVSEANLWKFAFLDKTLPEEVGTCGIAHQVKQQLEL